MEGYKDISREYLADFTIWRQRVDMEIHNAKLITSELLWGMTPQD